MIVHCFVEQRPPAYQINIMAPKQHRQQEESEEESEEYSSSSGEEEGEYDTKAHGILLRHPGTFIAMQ